METGIEKAVRLAGSQTALGELVGLSPQAVQKWVAQGFVPGERCRSIESLFDGEVTRYELNPGVFGEAPVAATQSTDQILEVPTEDRRKNPQTPQLEREAEPPVMRVKADVAKVTT